MKRIDGREIATTIREELKSEISDLKARWRPPGLAVVLVGSDPASETYVNAKEKACKVLGMHSEKYVLGEETSQAQLLEIVGMLNRNPAIDGILVQLPLPGHIDEDAVIRAIAPDKDVDGFHPENVGKLVVGQKGFISCTPYGIVELLKRSGVPLEGRHAVIVGRSNIVGKPMALLLLREHATVTVCHSRTRNLEEITRMGDILIAAVGRPEFIKASMVKEGAAVVDVGINRIDGKLVGDVAYGEVSEKAGWLTPVPGGVGPMTITMLMANTVLSARKRLEGKQAERL